MPERDFTPTQSLLLELKEERGGMQEGYRFLDEKRLILAAEILAELRRYEDELAAFQADYRDAARALAEAVGRHGVEGLGVHPADPPITAEMTLTMRSVLGVSVYDLACAMDPPPIPADDPLSSPEAKVCRGAFRALIPRAAQLAALVGNLERLREDYARTARRARALEDVLLPELDDTLRAIEGALEESDREEAVRARSLRV
jgi:V/A-type H+-transporting ATPase subunit D